ncbi:Tetraspanin [Sergentomyia squamirostris]
MSCGIKLVKILLILLNIICALCGIALFTVGITVLLTTSELDKIFGDYKEIASTAPILIITFGVVVFLISFCGCCGIGKKSYCLTMTYATILFILIVGKIVIAIICYVHAEDTVKATTKVFETAFHESNVTASRELVETVQKQLACCGLEGPKDWQNIPKSCCASSVTFCNIKTAYQTGCKSAIEDFIHISKYTLAWLGICIAAIELVALTFACILAKNFRRKENDIEHEP